MLMNSSQMTNRPRGPWARRVTRLLLSLAGLAAGVLGAELMWRVYLYGGRGLSYTLVDSMRLFPNSGMPMPSTTEGLSYELRPNLDLHYQMVTVRTNSAGMRDQEYSLEKPAGTWRIAFVGDSFTFAPGVSIEDAFHSRVEDRLNESGRGLTYECLSFGVPGYGADDYAVVIEKKVLAYDPDLIFICLCGNDKAPHKKHEPKYYEREMEHPFWQLSWGRELQARFGNKRLGTNPKVEDVVPSGPRDPRMALEDLEVAFGPTVGGRPRADIAAETRKKELPTANLEYMRQQWARIRELTLPLGIPVSTAYLTTGFVNHSTGGINAFAWRKVAAENGFGFLGTRGLFHNTNPMNVTIFKWDLHPNAEANRRYADAIYDYLEQEGLLGE